MIKSINLKGKLVIRFYSILSIFFAVVFYKVLEILTIWHGLFHQTFFKLVAPEFTSKDSTILEPSFSVTMTDCICEKSWIPMLCIVNLVKVSAELIVSRSSINHHCKRVRKSISLNQREWTIVQFSICKYSDSFERQPNVIRVLVNYRCWSIWYTFIKCTQLKSDLTPWNFINWSCRIGPFIWMNNSPFEISFEPHILLFNWFETVIKLEAGKHILMFLSFLWLLFVFFLLVDIPHTMLKFFN
jgi:hypothetical protein